ncbi:MAG: hypothetical protein ABIF22_00535 [bacterium]
MKESFEKITNNKEKLHNLEETGQYLFHGSPTGNIEILEPRQSEHFPDKNKPIKDGEPAVSTTPYSDIAIFRSIINRENIHGSSGFGIDDDKLKFSISSEKVLEEVVGKVGYVYVFDRKDFEPYSREGEATEKSMEWRSYKNVKPIEIIEVNFDDLPERENIEITEKK